MVGGHALVPLADVAALLDRRVVTHSGAFDLVPIASTNALVSPVSQSQGGWQFTVRSMQTVARYTPRFGDARDSVVSQSKADVLVLLNCRLHNGTPEMQEVYFDRDTSGNTALRDHSGRGYVPLSYDSRNSAYSSSKIPAGTFHDFVVIFSIPRTSRLKSLVFTVNNSVTRTGIDFLIGLG